MKELAKAFHELFAGLDRAHGEFTITGNKGAKNTGKASTVPTPPTVELWENHLKGKKGIGIVPIQGNASCVWGVIDIDSYENFDVTEKSISWSEKYPVVVCRSKSGGAHVFFFTTQPVPARLLRSKLQMLAGALGYPTAEIFPKQDSLGPEDIGNWLNMPYFDSEDTLRYGIRDGRSLTASEFIEYALSRKLQPDVLKALEFYDDAEFMDAPPCLQYYVSNGFPEGSRNDALFSLGVFARKAYPVGWESKVDEYNRRFMSPGTPEEVAGIIKGLRKTGYTYKCKTQPLCSQCNQEECNRRAHGIKKVIAKNTPHPLDDVDRPVHKYIPVEDTGELAYWILHIKGKKYRLDADKTDDQAKWIAWYVSTFDIKLPRIKNDVWDSKINELLADSIKHHQQDDETPEGIFWMYVKKYVTGKQCAITPDGIIYDKPWHDIDTNKVWLQAGPLHRYLIQNNFRHYSEHEIGPLLKKRGVHKQKNVKGKNRSCYVIEAYPEMLEEITSDITSQEVPF